MHNEEPYERGQNNKSTLDGLSNKICIWYEALTFDPKTHTNTTHTITQDNTRTVFSTGIMIV
jgi:hypothetical protein